jgi:hypothetical protein
MREMDAPIQVYKGFGDLSNNNPSLDMVIINSDGDR